MRARVPITLGLSLGVSLALSVTVGPGQATIVGLCLLLGTALVFGGWVLSADDRTERLERIIQALRGRPGKPAPRDHSGKPPPRGRLDKPAPRGRSSKPPLRDRSGEPGPRS